MSTDPTSSTALEFAAAFLAVILEGGPQPVEAITTRCRECRDQRRAPFAGPANSSA